MVDELTAAGILVGWNLTEAEWSDIGELVARLGVERLVAYTSRRWDERRPPKTARYLLRMWADLPASRPGTGTVVPLPRRAPSPGGSSTPYENGF
ncbi:hypothetical protein [Streptomyces sp. NPDC048172]|uniref:hypothetical protein n=1 Tax=Streptomyces sp. NPDC048172 TaxID=3365505 RepID=UPI003716EB84